MRVRFSFANLSMDSHPIHFHGHRWWIVGTDGGPLPKSAWWPEATVNVPPGTTRTVEFIADNPGDWPVHCHKNHHAMNAMSHEIPNVIGANQQGVARKIGQLVPGYMAMGETGMSGMSEMAQMMTGPKNTLPMMTGTGQFWTDRDGWHVYDPQSARGDHQLRRSGLAPEIRPGTVASPWVSTELPNKNPMSAQASIPPS